MNNRTLLALLSVILALAASSTPASAAPVPTYTFPDRWEASVQWWVQDALTAGRKMHALAYMWTDYDPYGPVRLGRQRVDELYYYPDIVGIPFGELGLDADHHLQTNEANYYFYLNATGMQCNILPNSGPMPPQHAFANQSAFVGVTTFEGRLVNVFTTQIEVVPGLSTRANLLQDVATLLPVRFNMEGVPPYDLLGPNEMTFLTFAEVSALPADVPLFNPPKACLNARPVLGFGSLASLNHRPLRR
jgi:hypothetical protein